jgi:uncharacterized protein (DUF302 family)
MSRLRILAITSLLFLVTMGPVSATEGLVTKPSDHSVDETLDRLEAGLKKSGYTIFTRLDHAAAAQSVGLKMPRSTVLVFGSPLVGTPNFILHPTLAIDLPLKALAWEDADGKVWLSYNTSEWINMVYGRHGAQTNPEGMARFDSMMVDVTDAAIK